MTICIAAICDSESGSPKIVYCADRLVTAGVKYEGLPKTQRLTNSVVLMSTTNDADASDSIIAKAYTKILSFEKTPKFNGVVNILKEECLEYKKSKYDQEILWNYQMIFDKFGSKPESLLKEAKDDVKYHNYSLKFDFLVAGLDAPDMAHIATINQDGVVKFLDSTGFGTIGIADGLAFSEMTKYSYNAFFPYEATLTLVYRAKKVCERWEGVGDNTDLGIIYFTKDEQTQETTANIQALTAHKDVITELEKSYSKIQDYERKTLRETSQKIKELLSGEKHLEENSTEESKNS